MGMVNRMPLDPRLSQERQMMRAGGGNMSMAVGDMEQESMNQIGQGGMDQMGGMMGGNPLGGMNPVRGPVGMTQVRCGPINQMGAPARMMRNPAAMNQMPRLGGVNQSLGPGGINQMGGLGGMNHMARPDGMNQMTGPGRMNQMGGLRGMNQMARPDGMNQMAGPGRVNQMGGPGGMNQMGTPVGINQMGPGGVNQIQGSGGMGRGSVRPRGGGNMNNQFLNQMMGNQMQMRMQGMQRQPAPPGAEMTRMRQPFMPLQQDGTTYSNNYQQQLVPPGVNESENEQVSLSTNVTDPKFAAQDEMEVEKLSVLQMQVKQWQQTQPVREFVQEFKNKMTGPPGVQPKEEVEEEEFEKQYKEWEKQFEDWKTQNANHPNQELFKQYEKQWLQWKDEMNQRRKEIRRRRDERLLQQSRLIQNTFSSSASQGVQQNVVYQQPHTQQIPPSTLFPGSFGRGPLPEQTSLQKVDTATFQEIIKADERQIASDKDKASITVSPTGSVELTNRFPPKGAPGNALKSDTTMAPSDVDAKPEQTDDSVRQEESKDKVIQKKMELSLIHI